METPETEVWNKWASRFVEIQIEIKCRMEIDQSIPVPLVQEYNELYIILSGRAKRILNEPDGE